MIQLRVNTFEPINSLQASMNSWLARSQRDSLSSFVKALSERRNRISSVSLQGCARVYERSIIFRGSLEQLSYEVPSEIKDRDRRFINRLIYAYARICLQGI